MGSEIKISVVIPSYNDGEYLPRALDSVLNQTLNSYEVIVIDDASTDKTHQTIAEYVNRDEIQYVRHSYNRGGAAARNTGIMTAEGEYVAFLDADDTWKPSKLERQVADLEDNPKYDANYCDVKNVNQGSFKQIRNLLSTVLLDHSKEAGKSGGEELVPSVLAMNFGLGGTSTLVVRRSRAVRMGGFDPHFERHQDWEFLIRLLKQTPINYVDAELVTKHETSLPDPNSIKRAKSRYFDKFSEDIVKYEKEGYRIQEAHSFDLARRFLLNGNLTAGVSELRGVSLNQNRILILLWVLGIGLVDRWVSTSK